MPEKPLADVGRLAAAGEPMRPQITTRAPIAKVLITGRRTSLCGAPGGVPERRTSGHRSEGQIKAVPSAAKSRASWVPPAKSI